ncbi:MAG: hypothetical protein MUF00_09465 [Gemmatimonadaceae bacterium]|jgi:hypothetical protein|nr:hypothetical protein [Gemmatimonadaceae bacterium]
MSETSPLDYSPPALEDEASVRAYLETRGCKPAAIAGGLAGLVIRWYRAVADVERGYGFTLDNYLDDVDARHAISGAWPHASPSAQARHADAVTRLDRRFIAATRAIDQCIWGKDNEETGGWNPHEQWYYYRLPLTLGDDLADDLRAEGLLDG